MKTKKLNKKAGTLRDRAREVYRDAILNAAEGVFAQRGIAGTRMSDVAKAAGLATGTLYNYFENRDALMSSLIEQRLEDLLTAVSAVAVAGTGEPTRAVLEGMVRASFAHFDRHRALFSVLMESAGISGKHMPIARRCVDAQRKFLAHYSAVLERAAGAGELRADLPRSLLVGILTGSAHGVVRAWMTEENAGPLVDSAPAVVDVFLRGASA